VADEVVEEKLHVVKEHQRRRVVRRTTCRCRHCGGRTTPRSLPAPYERSKVTCEWLGWLVYQKFSLLTPLDRLRRDLAESPADPNTIGHPELRRRMGMAALEALAQRIVVRANVRGLTRDEMGPYLQHRLRLAGCELPLLEPAAAEAIYQASTGLPRKANLLAHHALFAAAISKSKSISTEHVQAHCKKWPKPSRPHQPRRGARHDGSGASLSVHTSRLQSCVHNLRVHRGGAVVERGRKRWNRERGLVGAGEALAEGVVWGAVDELERVGWNGDRGHGGDDG